jgi:hypothetical protein
VRGEHLQRGARGGRERGCGGPLDVEDAHQAVLVDERQRELGHHPREERDITRVARDVGHEHHLARGGRRPDDAVARLQAEALAVPDVVAFDVGRDQEALVVGEEDVEDPVVHDAPQLQGDRREQLLRVEHTADLPDEREQVGEQLARQRRASLDTGRPGH